MADLPIILTRYNEHRNHGSFGNRKSVTRMDGVNNVAGIQSWPALGLAAARTVAGICLGALHRLEIPASVTGILLPLRLPHADTFAKS